MLSENEGNYISEDLKCQNFPGSMPPDPPTFLAPAALGNPSLNLLDPSLKYGVSMDSKLLETVAVCLVIHIYIVHVFVYVNAYVYVFVNVYVCVCVCVCVCMCI